MDITAETAADAGGAAGVDRAQWLSHAKRTGGLALQEISLERLDAANWYEACQLRVGEEQTEVFPISNVHWIGISRYEEGTTLYAIKRGGEIVGLIGGGLDEDGVSGFINPLMIDRRYQRQGIASAAMRRMMEQLIRSERVPRIRLGHRKENLAAGRLYDSLGFRVESETEGEVIRSYPVDHGVEIRSLRDEPSRLRECQELLLGHFRDPGLVKRQTEPCLQADGPLPQGYFLLKDDAVIGWAGLFAAEKVAASGLSPWISPLLVAPQERGNRYGKLLLQHARREASRLGYEKVYLTTDHIGYYEKYGFREIDVTTFTWGRPTKLYEHDALRDE